MNRLVARELERRWEQQLAERQRLGEAYARFRAEQPRHLTAADRERIRNLAADLPGLWPSSATTGADRRAIVRRLLERVQLTRLGDTERVDVAIHGRGGVVTRPEVGQGLRAYRARGGLAELRRRRLELCGDGLTADAIAEAPNREGYRVARGDAFRGERVRQLLARFGQTGVPPGVRDASDLPGVGEGWLPESAKKLGVQPIVGHRWRAVVGMVARAAGAGRQRPLGGVGERGGGEAPTALARIRDRASRPAHTIIRVDHPGATNEVEPPDNALAEWREMRPRSRERRWS